MKNTVITYVDLAHVNIKGRARVYIQDFTHQNGMVEYYIYLQRPDPKQIGTARTELVGSATDFQKATKNLATFVSNLIKLEGYYIVEQWKSSADGLRPEALDLLREHFPVGCIVEILESSIPSSIGKRGKLLEITSSGEFQIKGHAVRYPFEGTKFRKITN